MITPTSLLFQKSISLLALLLIPPFAVAANPQPSSCELGNGIKHVVVIGFDNFDSKRNSPNVPSDLEQVKSLRDFIANNGVILTNHHTALASFTNPGFNSIITGLYPDRHGVVGNDVGFFRPDNTSSTAASFVYWTTKIGDINTVPAANNTYFKISNVLGADGKPKNAPAPWVAFTRAGCDVGTMYDGTVLSIPPGTLGEVKNIFGAASTEAAEATANAALASARYSGLAVHCAQGSVNCSNPNTKVVDDVLPDEPGGYTNFKAIHGFKYLKPILSPGDELRDINGNIIRCYRNGCSVAGEFVPGYPGPRSNETTAEVSLGIAATMLEKGIPIYFGRVDAAHSPPGPNFPPTPPRTIGVGPGSAQYQAKLATMDAAFKKFFERLASAGINASNTLFIFTVEEEDLFVGSEPTPAGCDGVSTLCNYGLLGATPYNLVAQMTAKGINMANVNYNSTSWGIYVTGKPGPLDPLTRDVTRAFSTNVAIDAYTGLPAYTDNILLDDIGIELMHMKTSDPFRLPSITDIPNMRFIAMPFPPGIYNHGGLDPAINKIWLGMVGPGIRKDMGKGGDRTDIWSDHADVRPTMMSLLGLRDSYVHQGRVLFEAMYGGAIPKTLNAHKATLKNLGEVYKQLNAPLGILSQSALTLNAQALASGSNSDDSAYIANRTVLSSILTRRNALAASIESVLNDASFNGKAVNEQNAKLLIKQANQLICEVETLVQGNSLSPYCKGL